MNKKIITLLTMFMLIFTMNVAFARGPGGQDETGIEGVTELSVNIKGFLLHHSTAGWYFIGSTGGPMDLVWVLQGGAQNWINQTKVANLPTGNYDKVMLILDPTMTYRGHWTSGGQDYWTQNGQTNPVAGAQGATYDSSQRMSATLNGAGVAAAQAALHANTVEIVNKGNAPYSALPCASNGDVAVIYNKNFTLSPTSSQTLSFTWSVNSSVTCADPTSAPVTFAPPTLVFH